jgi:hypothetical protein
MSQSSDDLELRRRLRELEEENARLRMKSERVIVTEGEYKGHPTLTFEGPFRPFSLGVRKLSIIKEVWPEVEKFLSRHSTAQNNQKGPVDDDKI